MIKQLSRVALMGVFFAALTAFTVGFQTIKIQTSAVCGMCKDRIEGTLNAIEGVEEARLDLTTKKVKVKFDDSKQSEASLKAIFLRMRKHSMAFQAVVKVKLPVRQAKLKSETLNSLRLV